MNNNLLQKGLKKMKAITEKKQLLKTANRLENYCRT